MSNKAFQVLVGILLSTSCAADELDRIQKNVDRAEKPKETLKLLFTAIGMASNPDARSELDISDEQAKKILDFTNQAYRRKLHIEMSLRNVGAANYDQRLQAAEAFIAECEKLLSDTLLDFQIKRLKQYANQSLLGTSIPTSGLSRPDVAKRFGLDSKIDKEAIEKIDREVERDIQKLHKKIKNDLAKLLEERDRKLKALMDNNCKRKFDNEFGNPFVKFLEMYIVERGWMVRQNERRIEAAMKLQTKGRSAKDKKFADAIRALQTELNADAQKPRQKK